MPNITLETKYLNDLVGGNISIDKLSEQLYKLGFEVEHADANEIKIEVTANRPDLLGAVGMARALRYFMHRQTSFIHKLKSNEPELRIEVDKSTKTYRPFISGLVVHDIKLSDSALSDLFNFMDKFCDTFGRQRRKLAIGVHNLDAIKGGLKYSIAKDEQMLALHENESMKYSDLMEKNEKGVKYSDSIDASKGYPVLKDSIGTLALIPIINSERTKITSATRNLFIDITGTSEYLVSKTADMLASIFIELDGKPSGVEVNYSGAEPKFYPQMSHQEFMLRLSEIEDEIGVEIGFNNVLSLANKMGYEASFINKKIHFRVPEYRLDVINEQDIIEDIAIAYGYDYINPKPLPSNAAGMLEEKDALFERISYALVGMGFSESMNSYLTNNSTNFDKMNRKRNISGTVAVKDAKSSNIEILRTSLLPSLMNSLSLSKHEKMPQRIFELDMAFSVKDKTPVESYHIAAVSIDSESNFNYSKSVVSALFSAIGLELNVAEHEDGSFIPGRCAAIIINGKTAGIFGEVHPKVLRNFSIEEPVVAFEIDLNSVKLI
ncbi:MAG: phenylalanine--tRNA ligase subunit beta [Candidatus Marsarchaeota archaeon]|jgi:phenylalanyl-tRNA synthetase beta chain|nr:phenylalanine--tRNA ligase subunit beta [Candidatus Marsarchaeota archaeon]